ncbi:hypothetical protein CYMTET_5034 [Cymbomonas tetramitiformis]|uniref:Uncharacterized protein n=1 Tax=Cymbomonas tetramitiformis TaxID=36881 RepID=A0AAE0LJR5_9CHLO|nr:hypothetical protein CYMTET_5034 [Cymbomonas tetramitiformis]
MVRDVGGGQAMQTMEKYIVRAIERGQDTSAAEGLALFMRRKVTADTSTFSDMSSDEDTDEEEGNGAGGIEWWEASAHQDDDSDEEKDIDLEMSLNKFTKTIYDFMPLCPPDSDDEDGEASDEDALISDAVRQDQPATPPGDADQPRAEGEGEASLALLPAASVEGSARPAWMDWAHFVTTVVGSITEKELNNGWNVDSVHRRAELHQYTDGVKFASPSNIVAFLSLGIEFVMNINYAFANGVTKYWMAPQGGTTDDASNSSVATINNWSYYFWGSFLGGILYFAYSIPGIKRTKQGKFGKDNTGRQIAFGTRDWYYLQGLYLVGQFGYQEILSDLISVFACSKKDECAEAYVYGTDVQCWSSWHYFYIAAAVFSGILYYPAATFLYPNFQFADSTLDVKYSTTFLVTWAQAKLLIAVFAVFFNIVDEKTHFMTLRLLCGYTFILLGMGAVNEYYMPCMIPQVNIFRTLSFLMGASACFTTMIMISFQAAKDPGDVHVEDWHLIVGFSTLAILWILICVRVVTLYVRDARERKEEMEQRRNKFTKPRKLINLVRRMNQAMATTKAYQAMSNSHLDLHAQVAEDTGISVALVLSESMSAAVDPQGPASSATSPVAERSPINPSTEADWRGDK